MPGGKRHYWIAAILLLVLGGCLLLLLTNGGGKSSLSHRLPDGTVITIRKVSYGRIHKIVVGNSLQKIAGQILPNKLAKKLGIQTFTLTNKTISTCIFVETTGTNLNVARASGGWGLVTHSGTNSVPLILSGPTNVLQPGLISAVSHAYPNLIIPNLTGVVSADGTGDEIDLVNRIIFATSNRVVQAFQLPLDSHAARQLRLRLKYHDLGRGTSLDTEFTAPNPASRVPSQWTAPALPQTNRLDELQIVLLELHSCPNQSPPVNLQSSFAINLEPPTNLWTSARVQILQNGAPSEDFKVAGVRVEDEEGNTRLPGFIIYPSSDYPDVIRFEGAFSPKETRKFLFKISSSAPPYNSRAPGRYVEFLARPSPLATNSLSTRK